MNRITIPCVPMPFNQAIEIARGFKGFGAAVARLFPNLEKELKQAEIEVDRELYAGLIGMVFIFYALFGAFLGYMLGNSYMPQSVPEATVGAALLFGLLSSVQVIAYPKIIIKKKVREIERNLIFGLRTILVEIRSGVTLFDAINIVSQENTSQLSREFAKAVKKIQTGTYQNDALEDIAENNPSLYFRRSIWQLVNGLKSGGDVGTIMHSLVDSLSKEKANQVKKYGNSLKMLSLVYMMMGAIVPALGLTFAIVLSTLPNSPISEMFFYGMAGFLAVGQFMFIGIIKAARPGLLGD